MQNQDFVGFRLSPQQRHAWTLQNEVRACAQGVVWLEGDLDAARLRDSVTALVNRYEILRTTFYRPPGMKTPFQVISDTMPLAWREMNLKELSATEQSARIDELAREEQEHPSDVEHGPLLRVVLVALSDHKHALLLTASSLCADGPTVQHLAREIGRHYAAGSVAQSVAEGALQYADYSEWQNELLQTNDEAQQSGKRYWQEHGFSSIPVLALPLETKPEAAQPAKRASVSFEINPDVTSRVEAVGRELRADPASVLLACWHSLLWRLTGETEIPVIRVFDGRDQEELVEALGPFARPVPVTVRFNDTSTFTEILQHVEEVKKSADQWRTYLPGEDGAAVVGSSGNRFVGFEFHHRLPQFTTNGLAIRVDRLSAPIGSFKLSLRCEWGEGVATARLSYRPEALERDEVQRIAGYYGRMLADVVQNPSAPIAECEILTASEREQLVDTFNQTATDDPIELCIHHLFEVQAERTPESLALVFDSEERSYRELNARANQLAHGLRRQGVTSNTRVGLFVDRSAEMIVGLLGILKAGGAYVPLDPALPKSRIAYQLAEAGALLVVTQQSLVPQLTGSNYKLISLDGDQAALASELATNPAGVGTPDDLAYVIYTSGSTGNPKGVAVTHRNLANYTQFMTRKLKLKPGALSGGPSFATVSTLSADLGNTSIFPCLVSGGCLHVISQEASLDGDLFAQYLENRPIDVLKITPSNLRALMASKDARQVLPRKHLILGGEVCSWDLAKRVREASGCAVINHYGPTETTIGTLTFDLEGHQSYERYCATVPIGRPIGNSQAYILDRRQRPVPIGVAGELYVGGAGVTRGYLDRPELTAERFVPNPFSTRDQGCLYRTGDRARFLADGTIEFLGRVDHQIKIRGYRVELEEIETVLSSFPSVQQAVVLLREVRPGDQRLTAYIVPSGQAEVEQLRSFSQERLPGYMVPSEFVVLEAFPLTSNGKADRQALLASEFTEARPKRPIVEPRSPVEEKLAGIWSEVLGVGKVSVHDNFFELGGHSLLATQVISRIRTAFEVQLPLRSIFEAPILADLAEKVTQQLVEESGDEEITRLLAEVEALSDDEAKKLLEGDPAMSGGTPAEQRPAGESGARKRFV